MRPLESRAATARDASDMVQADLNSWRTAQAARAGSERIGLAIVLGAVVLMSMLVLLNTGI